MLQEGLPGAAEQTGKFGPGIRTAHVDDSDRLDPWFRCFNAKEARGLAALNTAPELPLSRDNEVLIERIGMSGDLRTERTALLAAITHMLCCSCGMYFSATTSSENDQGSMNLASKTAPVASTRPSRVAAIQRITG